MQDRKNCPKFHYFIHSAKIKVLRGYHKTEAKLEVNGNFPNFYDPKSICLIIFYLIKLIPTVLKL